MRRTLLESVTFVPVPVFNNDLTNDISVQEFSFRQYSSCFLGYSRPSIDTFEIDSIPRNQSCLAGLSWHAQASCSLLVSVQKLCSKCLAPPIAQTCAPLLCSGASANAITCARCAKSKPPANCRLINCVNCGCPLVNNGGPVCGINKAGITKTYLSECHSNCAKAVCSRGGACPVPLPVLPVLPSRFCIPTYTPVCGVRLGVPCKSYVNLCVASIDNVWCSCPGIC